MDEDTLLDTIVRPMGYGEEEGVVQSQDITKPDLGTAEGGRDGQVDGIISAPSVVQGSSLHSQPLAMQRNTG